MLWQKLASGKMWCHVNITQTFFCYHQDLFLAVPVSHHLKLEGQRRSIIIYLSIQVPFSHCFFFFNPCIKPLIRSGLLQLLCNLIKMSPQYPLPLLPDSQLCHVDHIVKKLEHRPGTSVLFWKTMSLIRVREGEMQASSAWVCLPETRLHNRDGNGFLHFQLTLTVTDRDEAPASVSGSGVTSYTSNQASPKLFSQGLCVTQSSGSIWSSTDLLKSGTFGWTLE